MSSLNYFNSLQKLVVNEKMRRLSDKSFKFNIIFMKIVGLYPMDCFNKIAFKIYGYIFYSLFTVPVPTLTIIYLFVNEVDIYIVADNLFLISQIGILIIKLLPFIRNPDEVHATIEMINSEIFNDYTLEQEKYINECIATCKRIFHIFLTFCWASLFSWGSKPLFNSGQQLPVSIWLPFDVSQSSGKIYWLLYLFTFLGVSNAASSNAAVDTLIPGLACHATGQLRILKDNLTHLNDYAEKQVPKESKMSHQQKEMLKADIIYKRIKKCVKHHDAIIQFVDDLEETYSFVVFTQFLASIFVICISCYELTIVVPLSIPFFGMIIYITTMLSEIFLYCYYGTILHEESGSLPNAIYMSQWYEFDIKSQKALIILMERSKRPLIITAGKVLDLSLETFTTILRRSYSFFAVLRNYSN